MHIFLRLPVPSFLLAFSFPFSRPFYSRYLLRFIFFLAFRKTVNFSFNEDRTSGKTVVMATHDRCHLISFGMHISGAIFFQYLPF